MGQRRLLNDSGSGPITQSCPRVDSVGSAMGCCNWNVCPEGYPVAVTGATIRHETVVEFCWSITPPGSSMAEKGAYATGYSSSSAA